jgi:acetyltransferase
MAAQSTENLSADPPKNSASAESQDKGLDALFAPKSIALIGATDREGSVGHALAKNLSAFTGTLFFINANKPTVCGRTAYPNLASIGESARVDLAVIATPAARVPATLRECAQAGVKAAIVISAGFREAGNSGAALEREMLLEAARGGIRILGPNCLGLMAPHASMNATFAAGPARPGMLAFISQSGALCTAILDWSFGERVGFSGFVSVGSMSDVGWSDLIRHFSKDPNTRGIVMYMESIDRVAQFIDAALDTVPRKPIIAIKVGRTKEASRAAASHTGAMTGDDATIDALFQRAGVIRVDSIEELFDTAELLSKTAGAPPKGASLAVLTNAGGPAALATDSLIRSGGRLCQLNESTIQTLNALLPAHWSHGNPIDILGDADADRYRNSLRAVLEDPHANGALVILTPQSMTQPLATAQAIIDVQRAAAKPVLASWMGGESVAAGRELLNAAGIATFDYPDEAARAWMLLWSRAERLPLIAEARRVASLQPAPMAEARAALAEHLSEATTLLTETASKLILHAAGIPTNATVHASSEEDAVAAAKELGFPAVLKLHSKTITHKSDVGGVRLNLEDAAAVREAWRAIQSSVPKAAFDGVSVQRMFRGPSVELICGFRRDPQYGPVLIFGAGGVLVETLRDTVILLPPLSRMLVMDRIRQTRIFSALKGTRQFREVDLDALADLIIRVGELALAAPEIEELDINPLVFEAGLPLVLDARITCRHGLAS